MRSGMSPKVAAEEAIMRIAKKYTNFEGAIVVANKDGQYAAACWGLGTFPYAVANDDIGGAEMFQIPCLNA